MYIMFNVESVALKKSKSFCFASKEKCLKSDSVKSNEENKNSLSSWKCELGYVFFWETL